MPVKTKRVKENGTAKAQTPQANGNAEQAIKKLMSNTSLDERLRKFEELSGLNSKRDSVNGTLTHLQKFNFSQTGSCSLTLQDQSGQQFSTSNTNLITMLATGLQTKLEEKKKQLEEQIIAFEF